MRRVVLCLAALALVAGCGGAKQTRTAREAAQAFYEIAEQDLSAPANGGAIGKRYKSCKALIDKAPAGKRADIRYTAPVIMSAAGYSTLPAQYHRFASDLGKVDVHGDRGLIAIRREVDSLDASLQRRHTPTLDVCTFLEDWKKAGWEPNGFGFVDRWLKTQGWTQNDAIGAQIGSGVDAVAPQALRRLGLSKAKADAFTQAAEIYYDPS
jgi:hypothetical protein